MFYLFIVFLIDLSLHYFLMGWLINLGSFVSAVIGFFGFQSLGTDFYFAYRDIVNLDNSLVISLVLGLIVYALIYNRDVQYVEDNVKIL